MNLVVSIDYGNTRTHLGLIDCDRSECLSRVDIVANPPSEAMAHALLDLLTSVPKSQVVPVNVAAGDTKVIAEALISLGTPQLGPVHAVEYHQGLPVRFAYKVLSKLGPDRIANCLFAHKKFAGRHAILISAGTAITVDLLHAEDGFLGGAILPGSDLQCKALASATRALPLVDLDTTTLGIPGTSTEECIACGVRYGVAGAVTMLVSSYQNRLGKDCLVLGTGGGWDLLASLLDFEAYSFSDMTLIGVGLYKENI